MIDFGSHKLDWSTDVWRSKAQKAFANKDAKVTGGHNRNLFYKISGEDETFLSSYFNEKIDEKFDWKFEYFHSGEPASIHTDYDTIPWDDKSDCHVVVGIIIPLEWKCKQPYTINFTRKEEYPRKLIYRNGGMRYTDTGEEVIYRTEEKLDKEVEKYIPYDCEYRKMFYDLQIESVYKWEIGTFMLFDTARWHASSWFLTNRLLQDAGDEYKSSIIGFGSIDVLRN